MYRHADAGSVGPGSNGTSHASSGRYTYPAYPIGVSDRWRKLRPDDDRPSADCVDDEPMSVLNAYTSNTFTAWSPFQSARWSYDALP